jgi:ribonuclease P protein component
VTVIFLPAPAGPPRVAYAVSRRVGGAVERNRLRRRLRAVVAGAAPRLAPGAYLVAATPELAALPYPELEPLVAGVMEEVSR